MDGHEALPDVSDYDSMVAYARRFYDGVASQYDSRARSAHQTLNRTRILRTAPLAPSGGRALDVGCGVGLTVRLLAEMGFQVTGIDVSPVMLEYAERRNPGANLIRADVMRLSPGVLGTFDWVSAHGFLHVFPRTEAMKILQHLGKFVTDSGVLAISTTVSTGPTKEGWLPKHKYSGAPIRFRTQWNAVDLLSDVKSNGMEIVDDFRIWEEDGTEWISLTLRPSGGNARVGGR